MPNISSMWRWGYCASAVAIFLIVVPPSSALARPNIVLAILDDCDGDMLFPGHPQAKTPNLQRLATQSTCFVDGMAVVPMCRPSLASLVSGKHPWNHGIEANIGFSAHLATDGALPALLSAAGYETRIDGKWWEGPPADYGFDTIGELDWTGVARNASLVITWQRPTFRWLHQMTLSGQPWFLWWGPYLPHTSYAEPWPTPQRYLDLYPAGPERNLLARTTWLDDGFGDLMGQLALHEQLENTLIIVLNDNGWKENGLVSKVSWYDAGIIVPFFFSWKGQIASQTFTGHATMADIYATILDYAEVAAPAGIDGRSLRPQIEDRTPLTDVQHGLCSSAVALQRFAIWRREPAGWKYARALADFSPTYLIEGPIANFSAGDEFLFDLLADPNEQTNLVGDPAHAAKLVQMRDATNAWYATITPPPPQAQIVIIDDEDSQFSSVGNWRHGPLGFRNGMHYEAAGNGSQVATFSASVGPGRYLISATWKETSNRATNTRFTIKDGSSPILTAVINQQTAPDDRIDQGVNWEDLGTFDIQQSLSVDIDNLANGYVIADAIRIEKQ